MFDGGIGDVLRLLRYQRLDKNLDILSILIIIQALQLNRIFLSRVVEGLAL